MRYLSALLTCAPGRRLGHPIAVCACALAQRLPDLVAIVLASLPLEAGQLRLVTGHLGLVHETETVVGCRRGAQQGEQQSESMEWIHVFPSVRG